MKKEIKNLRVGEFLTLNKDSWVLRTSEGWIYVSNKPYAVINKNILFTHLIQQTVDK